MVTIIVILLLLIHCSGAGDDDSGAIILGTGVFRDDDGDVKFFPRFFFC